MKANSSRFTDPRLERIFNLEELPEVTLAITVDNWNRMLAAFDEAPGENYWIPGDFIFCGSHSIADQTISNVALRIRGNTSRNRPALRGSFAGFKTGKFNQRRG
ncbi:hypothetical protein IR083_01045 [Dysgonomonas sp. GY75]|uniref:hypothetical protein n=1 Tax=Dysgonomonas sp. GY75 TaxID=2780419 RepID=UPI00188322F1|nr:hypothetical protein [Dysgonomonas sp. GY75]MBF0647402.1 hypothetical protein [Dysgonomonas sp. GY75]